MRAEPGQLGGQRGAHVHDDVGGLDQLGGAVGQHRAGVVPGEGGVARVQDAAGGQLGDHRDAVPLGQLRQVVRGTEPRHQLAHDQHRPLRGGQQLGQPGLEGGQRVGVGVRDQRPGQRGGVDRGQREVLRDGEVAGLAVGDRGQQHGVDLLGGPLGGHRLRGHGHLGGGAGEVPEVAVGQRVVDQRAGLHGGAARRAHDLHQRHVLGGGAGEGVEHRQLPHAVGGDHDAQAAAAGVGVGGVPGAELVGRAHPGRAVHREAVEQVEVEVARDAEQVLDAQLPQPGAQVGGEGDGGGALVRGTHGVNGGLDR
ncbi:unannotated protein [freshwater metagenome]|uniref:Unannotated protein n=1 Tax=freshwater metagenome TaxID=449393 RepID=A0A6J7IWT9_9ZZZZ